MIPSGVREMNQYQGWKMTPFRSMIPIPVPILTKYAKITKEPESKCLRNQNSLSTNSFIIDPVFLVAGRTHNSARSRHHGGSDVVFRAVVGYIALSLWVPLSQCHTHQVEVLSTPQSPTYGDVARSCLDASTQFAYVQP